MGRRLEWGTGWLLNLDPGQNAPWRCMQGTCMAHTYHLTIRLQPMELCVWYLSVNYAAGAIGKRFNCIIMILCALLQTTMIWGDVYHPPSTRCDLHRQIHWSTLCAWYVCNTARSFTHWSNTCVLRSLVFLILGFIEQMSFNPLPATLYNLVSQNSGVSLFFSFKSVY